MMKAHTRVNNDGILPLVKVAEASLPPIMSNAPITNDTLPLPKPEPTAGSRRHTIWQSFITAVAFGITALFGTMNANAGNWADVTNRVTSWGANYSSTSTFYIGTPQELAQFAWMVNDGQDFSNKTVNVTNNLTMSAHYWTPAGTINRTLFSSVVVNEQPFLGTFNGNNYTITGIAMNPDDTLQYAGLFGYIGQNGIIKNVTLDKVFVLGSSRWSAYAGGIVGYNYGTVENCKVFGAKSTVKSACVIMDSVSKATDLVGKLTGGIINLTIPEFNFAYAGGIVGFNNGGTVTKCENSAKVKAIAWTTIASAGGVVGSNVKGTVVDCVNNGKVESKSTDILTEVSESIQEGIIAVLEDINSNLLQELKEIYKDLAKEIFKKAVEEAVAAKAPLPSIAIKVVINYSYSGGVAGMNESGTLKNNANGGSIDADSSTCSTISELITLIKTIIAVVRLVASWGGDIKAWGDITISATGIDIEAHAGGAAGWNSGTIDSCTNTGGIDAHCFNLDYTSLIVGFNLPSYAGGMTGYNVNGVIRNCSNSGALNGRSDNWIVTALSGGSVSAHAGGMAGKSSSGVIENSYNNGRVYSKSFSASLGSAYTYARGGGVAGIQNGGRIENCMSRGAVFADWVNVTPSFWVYFSAGSFSEAGGLVGENKKDSTVANSYWRKNGSSGLNRNAVGKNNGTQKTCFFFDAMPGTLSGSASVGNVSNSRNLQEVLNGWVGNEAKYYRWSVVANPMMEGGYPFLSRPVAVTFDANNTKGSTVFPTSINVTYGNVYGTLPSPTPRSDGYYFAGWFTSTNAGQTASANTVVTNGDNHTLYARWVTDWSMYATDMPTPVGNTYTLTTEGELAAFMVAVNKGNPFSGKTFVLANDLNLSAYPWVPIGTNSATAFRGIFDGQGHTINGLEIKNIISRQYAGLFGYIGTGGIVRDVNLTNTIITANYAGTVYVGGVAGYNAGGSNGGIFNCSVSGTVSGTASGSASTAYVGGVVGYNASSSRVEGCVKSSSVTANSGYDAIAGGVVGYNLGITRNSSNNGSATANSPTSGRAYAGGVTGVNDPSGTIQNCLNSGSVTGTTSVTRLSLVGGVAGENRGAVSNCTNKGGISSSSKSQVGGVAGYNASDATVSHCSNSGTVNGTSSTLGVTFDVGGVVGNNNGTVSYCMNSAMVSASAADISKGGGIVGYNSGTVSNSINTSTGTVDIYVNPTYYSYSGGIVGFNECVVSSCSNSGSVVARTGNRRAFAGGVVGANGGNDAASNYGSGNAIIRNCSNSGSVSSATSGEYCWAGGVAGYNRNSDMKNCMNSGSVTTTGAGRRTGGVAATNDGGLIENCTNRGSLSGDNGWLGGIVGRHKLAGTIKYCYWHATNNNTPKGFTDSTGGSTQDPIRYFKDTSGTLYHVNNTATSVTVNGTTASILLTALNRWVNGSSTYSSWVVTSNVNGGYPYLTNSHFTLFDGNDGMPLTQMMTHTPGATYGTLPTPTRTGYSFKGWFTAATNGTQVTNTTSVSLTTFRTLYAQWIPNTYAVTYNANGGSPASANITQTYDSKYILPTANPTRTGYTFAGWWTANGTSTGSWGTQVTTNTTVKITASQTLYARWTPNQYRVTFNAMGGTVSPAYEIMTFDAPYGKPFAEGGMIIVTPAPLPEEEDGGVTPVVLPKEPVGELPVPQRRGYKFVGWTFNGSPIHATTIVTNAYDHILTAKWIDRHENDKADNGTSNGTNWADEDNQDKDWGTNYDNPSVTNFFIGTPRELARFAWMVNQGKDFNNRVVFVTNDLVVTTCGIRTNDLDEVAAYTNGLSGIPYYTSYAVTEHTNTVSDGESEIEEVIYTVSVTNDLSMAKYYWTPAGDNSTTSRRFRGTFDGQGHAIQGITIYAVNISMQYAGLFGYLDDGDIRNVNLTETDIVVSHANAVFVGGVAGYNDRGTIENCVNVGLVSASSASVSSFAHVGGVVGFNSDNAAIVNNTSSGAVEAFASSSSRVGGVAGHNSPDGLITDSMNSASVSAFSNSSRTDRAGGVVGNNNGVIMNCENNGTVDAMSSDFAFAGGIAGVNDGFIMNCQNNKSVGALATTTNSTFTARAGGIAGDNYGYVYNCVNRGEVSVSVMPESCAGGVVGHNYGGEIRNCINLGAVSASADIDYAGGVVGLNTYGGDIFDCHWRMDGTDGFTNNAAGHLVSGTTNGLFSFDEPSVNLLADLNDWVATYKWWNYQDEIYQSSDWTLEGSRDGYPILTCFNHLYRWDHERNRDLEWVYSTANGSTNVIRTAQELAQFAWLVNQGINFANTTTILASDITLSAYHWTPVEGFHQGIFDGQGHTIHGLTINAIDTLQFVGLFGLFTGTVRNVNLSDVEISVFHNTSSVYIGSVAAYNWGIIENCANNNGMISTVTDYLSYLGGMAGLNNGSIINCVNDSSINSTCFTITGIVNSIGGIAGANHSVIKNCVNNGEVNTGYRTESGGVAGVNSGTIVNCVNNGEVKSGNYAGGITGYNSLYGVIINCMNCGSLSSSTSGGVARNNAGIIQYCYWKTGVGTTSAVGLDYGGFAEPVRSFTDAPGMIGILNVYGTITPDLLTALRCWVTANGGSTAGYWDWKVDGDMNDGYPSLSEWTLEVTLDSNDETPSPQTMTMPQTYRSKYLLPIFDPERKGYRFKGWFTAANGGTEVTPTTMVATTANHTLWAQWSLAVTHTSRTPVPVPYEWLDLWENNIANYEDFAESEGINGVTLWESYVAGLIPTNAASKFAITNFVVNAGSRVSKLEWSPNYENDPDPKKRRVYIIKGKEDLSDKDWHSPTNSASRFFKVEVKLP